MLMVNLQQHNRPENYPILQIRPARIIVVDNDKMLCSRLSGAFQKLGFQHRIYHQVADIVPLAEDFRPDLVLTEYLLPCSNGGELCAQLRSCQRTCRIPVVIYSSLPKTFLSLGASNCNAFLQKPFSIPALLKVMSCFLSNCCDVQCSQSVISSISNLN